MNPKVVRITETAAMTALLIALQAVTRSAGQYVTGSCVNAVLALTALLAGLWSGVVVAVLSPFFAFLLGIGPQAAAITPVIALGIGPQAAAITHVIALGNVVFVVLMCLLTRRKGAPPEKQIAAWLVPAVGKFAALYLVIVQILCRVLPLKQPQIDAFSATFSYPQLVTALVGGGLALVLAPVLRRALKQKPI